MLFFFFLSPDLPFLVGPRPTLFYFIFAFLTRNIILLIQTCKIYRIETYNQIRYIGDEITFRLIT